MCETRQLRRKDVKETLTIVAAIISHEDVIQFPQVMHSMPQLIAHRLSVPRLERKTTF